MQTMDPVHAVWHYMLTLSTIVMVKLCGLWRFGENG